jgi:hypothetical protein
VQAGNSQGVGLATGLQNTFDRAGVAEAGLRQGVKAGVGAALQGTDFGFDDPVANAAAAGFVSGAAGVIAGAAARTLINGSDFGDNILRALPSLGQTVGNAIAQGQDSDNSTAQADNTPQPGQQGSNLQFASTDGDADFATAARLNPQVAAALGAPAPQSQSSEGFFGWLGDEISSGWNALVQGGENFINDASEAVGLGQVFSQPTNTNPSQSNGIETVTVTAQRLNNGDFNLWSPNDFWNLVSKPSGNNSPYYAVGGPPNSRNAVTYFYPDGTTEVRTGGTLAWRDNNPGNLRGAPDEIGSNTVYSAITASHNAQMAIFPDVQTGLSAQESLLFGPKYNSLSIAAAITKYAPPAENPTADMINELTAATGVSSTTIMG